MIRYHKTVPERYTVNPVGENSQYGMTGSLPLVALNCVS
jgi:hypothetical protein